MSFNDSLVALMHRQYWVVSRPQLLSHGMSVRQIDRRVASGKLVVLARGVYTPKGAPVHWQSHAMAAWLVSKERTHPAVLAATTAGAFWDLPGVRPPLLPELFAKEGDRHPNPLGAVSRRSDLCDDDIVMHECGAAITTPVRTAVDLLLGAALDGSLDEMFRRLSESDQFTIHDVLRRFAPMSAANRPGSGILRRHFASRDLALAA